MLQFKLHQCMACMCIHTCYMLYDNMSRAAYIIMSRAAVCTLWRSACMMCLTRIHCRTSVKCCAAVCVRVINVAQHPPFTAVLCPACQTGSCQCQAVSACAITLTDCPQFRKRSSCTLKGCTTRLCVKWFLDRLQMSNWPRDTALTCASSRMYVYNTCRIEVSVV